MTLTEFLEQVSGPIQEKKLIRMTLSKPHKSYKELKRVALVPVQLKAGYRIQFSLDDGKHERHENLEPDAACIRLAALLPQFRQADGHIADEHLHALFSEDGTVHVKKVAASSPSRPAGEVSLHHNRNKNHILPDGTALDFLVELGLMGADGMVFKSRYDKFRQINRFVEFVDNVADKLPPNKTLSIVDFGCGKAYLTFALYHYLVRLKGFQVKILGLDLKKDLMEQGQALADKMGMTGLQFKTGDIADHRDENEVDMVVSLHACDTATDVALAFAVQHNAQVILSAPCCQHELFGQLEAPRLQALSRFGLLKERFAALATDALRGNILELNGYQVDMVEFIDPEHTPKNLMIRAWKSPKAPKSAQKTAYAEFRDMLGAHPYLEKLLLLQD